MKTTEPDLQIRSENTEMPEFIIDDVSQNKLINALYAAPHGVMQMSRDIPNFVETSTNLASVKLIENYFLITTSQRSSVASALDDIVNMVAAVFHLIDAEVAHNDGYPGWTPNTNSEILDIAKYLSKTVC